MIKKQKRRFWSGEASLRSYTDNAIRGAAPGWRRCLRRFAVWLEEERGLAVSSITVRVTSARAFLEAQAPAATRALRRLDVARIEDFFIDYAEQHGRGATRSMQAALRLFLKFAAGCGWVKDTLADAVPSMRSYALSHLPRGLTREQVRTVVDGTSTSNARDRAIVLVLATYGVRRGQISALDLEDVDWRARTIRFAGHKRGKEVVHRLVPVVAAALAAYLRDGRPKADESAVFVTLGEPYRRLSPSSVTAVVHALIQRLELRCTPCGPHALRHAFAARLVEQGETPKVIADLLGHRSLDSVALYAKIDHPRMLQVAVEWPEVSS